MAENAYSIFSLNQAAWPQNDTQGSHVTVTEYLRCTETHIDYYRTEENKSVDLNPDREALSVPLNNSGVILFEKPVSMPRLAVTCKPAGTEASLHSGAETTWIVVSTTPETAPEEPLSIIPENLLEFVTPSTSDIETAHLTEPLGCQGMKANIRRLEPGHTVSYHIEHNQEELYVPLDGPGTLRVNGTTRQLNAGDIVRIKQGIPRGAVNQGDETRSWLMIGAPPTGDPNEWDPDTEYAQWPHNESASQ